MSLKCSHAYCWSSDLIALMMEAARNSETSVDNYFTRKYIPEDKSELYTSRRENLKSHMPIVHLPEYMSMEGHNGMILTGEANPVPMLLFQPRTPHGITRRWTVATAVRGRRPTAWAMARLWLISYIVDSGTVTVVHRFPYTHTASR
jgi:hypothetical protein